MANCCEVCEGVVKSSKSGVACEVQGCGLWYHTKCLLADQLTKEKRRTVWRCPACRSRPAAVLQPPALAPLLLQQPHLQPQDGGSPMGSRSPVYGTPTDSPTQPFSMSMDMGNAISKLQQDVAKVLANQATAASHHVEIKSTQEDMRKALEFAGDTIQELKATVAQYAARITDLEKLKPEVQQLRMEVSRLRAERDDTEQAAFDDYVEVKGIPDSQVNLKEAVMSIAKAVECPLQEGELVEVDRARGVSKKPQKEVRIKFAKREVRDQFLTCARTKRPLTAHSAAGLRTELEENAQAPIYVNELLTHRKKQLLFNAKAYARNHNIRYTWTKKGQVLMRKADDAKPFIIKHENDLDLFFQRKL